MLAPLGYCDQTLDRNNLQEKGLFWVMVSEEFSPSWQERPGDFTLWELFTEIPCITQEQEAEIEG